MKIYRGHLVVLSLIQPTLFSSDAAHNVRNAMDASNVGLAVSLLFSGVSIAQI